MIRNSRRLWRWKLVTVVREGEGNGVEDDVGGDE